MKKYLFPVVALALCSAPAWADGGHPVTPATPAAHSILLPGVEVDAVGPHHPHAARHHAPRAGHQALAKTRK
ncbi:hypothetical protein [Hymenobacter chitinivorans]|uniref:Uncharacterized protein n=1 Tax=Hymenobacter chitinivorans DSM 11115 TaxID=1121954 RepID=A0A2M9BPD2_9BACT|nr:hypothetical protein [Hymenobacter chitinivorans]PJJ59806.1 hypothetical protein CLV45_1228 [Hymenobacter chitinivorans DSM 11115]